MSALTVGLLSILGILSLSAIGVPVAIAVALTGGLGMYLISGSSFALTMFQTIPYSTAADFALVVVPSFIFMGMIAATTGMIEAMFRACRLWLARIRGNLFHAVTLASACFAAVSGSSVVNAAVFSRMALPQMEAMGYNRALSAGCIASAGTFAVMIPPSLGFVIYGFVTGESIGKLFMAGIIPGLLTVVVYISALALVVNARPSLAPEVEPLEPLRTRLLALRPLWSFGVLVLIVLGGIYMGYFSPSAAGAIGATGAALIGFAQRSLSVGQLWKCARDTVQLSASIFFILIAGFIFSRFLVTSGFIREMTEFLGQAGIGQGEFIIIMILLYLVLGMFIDGSSMAVITLPFIYPIAISLGLDGIWLGVIFVKMVELGSITPPMGLNLFAVVAASDGRLRLTEIARGVLLFVVLELMILTILILFPILSLYLPQTMM